MLFNPKHQDLLFNPKRQDLLVNPKHQDLLINPKRQDLSTNPKRPYFYLATANMGWICPSLQSYNYLKTWALTNILSN